MKEERPFLLENLRATPKPPTVKPRVVYQTSKQVKEAFKARGGNLVPDAERKRVARLRQLDDRKAKIQKQDARKKENAMKRKQMEANGGAQKKQKKLSASQPPLAAFFVGGEKAKARAESSEKEENRKEESEEEEDESEEEEKKEEESTSGRKKPQCSQPKLPKFFGAGTKATTAAKQESVRAEVEKTEPVKQEAPDRIAVRHEVTTKETLPKQDVVKVTSLLVPPKNAVNTPTKPAEAGIKTEQKTDVRQQTKRPALQPKTPNVNAGANKPALDYTSTTKPAALARPIVAPTAANTGTNKLLPNVNRNLVETVPTRTTQPRITRAKPRPHGGNALLTEIAPASIPVMPAAPSNDVEPPKSAFSKEELDHRNLQWMLDHNLASTAIPLLASRETPYATKASSDPTPLPNTSGVILDHVETVECLPRKSRPTLHPVATPIKPKLSKFQEVPTSPIAYPEDLPPSNQQQFLKENTPYKTFECPSSPAPLRYSSFNESVPSASQTAKEGYIEIMSSPNISFVESDIDEDGLVFDSDDLAELGIDG